MILKQIIIYCNGTLDSGTLKVRAMELDNDYLGEWTVPANTSFNDWRSTDTGTLGQHNFDSSEGLKFRITTSSDADWQEASVELTLGVALVKRSLGY